MGSNLSTGRGRSFFGSSAATRGASGDAEGSGAPATGSARDGARLALLFSALLATLVALTVGIATAAMPAKKVDSVLGSPTGATGNTAGIFNIPRGIAINQNGTGGALAGDFYVVDGTNNRIQQFRANNTFVRAFGLDVVASGPDNASEVQWVTVNATAGSFKLTFGAGTTADLPYNATAGEVQTALNALASVSAGGGSVAVSGGPGDGTGSTPYVVSFNGGPLKGTDVAQMTGANGATPLSGGSGFGANAATVTTANNGANGYEICDALANPTDVCKAGVTAGGLGGTLAAPQGIAVDQATGALYVTDSTNRRIQKFSASGAWLAAFGWDTITNGAATGDPGNVVSFQVCTVMQYCKVGVAGTNAGQLSSSVAGQPAVDTAGNVYVPDVGNFRVQKFSSAGAFLAAWGWDVVPTGKTGDTGTAFETCPPAAANTSGDCKAGVSGSGAGQFGAASPTRIAIDSTNKLYVVDNGNKRVVTSNSTGGAPATFLQTDLEPSPTDVAIGPSNNVFVIVPCPTDNEVRATVCPGSSGPTDRRLKEFNPAGVLQATSLEGSGITATNGLAASTVNDKVLFSTSGNFVGEPGSRVFVADNDGSLPAPTLTINPPADITEHTASFSGSVNPNGPIGLPTSYRFEYSRNGVTWTPVAAEVNLGGGTSSISVPIAAEGSATGLEANTFYRVRIVAKKAFGAATAFSQELVFLTDAVGPEVQTFYPQAHTDTTATLLGSLNAGNLPTTYRFEYGKTTSYGTSVPVPAGSLSDGVTHIITEVVSGLQPSTTYHYRLVATNSEGTTIGSDVAFTTRAEGVAQVPERAYEMVTPPLKSTRSSGKPGGGPQRNPNPGVASPSGGALMWTMQVFPINSEAKFPFGGDQLRITRTADGWEARTQFTQLPLLDGINPLFAQLRMTGASADFGTTTWTSEAGSGIEVLPNASSFKSLIYSRKDGTGTNGFSNWLPNVQAVTAPYGLTAPSADRAQFNDDGSWMVRWGNYRGLLGTTAAEDASVTQLAGAAGGATIYRQQNAPSGPIDLVSGCTGTVGGGDATAIPMRFDNGTPANLADDTIAAQACEQGAVTSVRGATVGSTSSTGIDATGRAASALSNDGMRVFFQSPDFSASGAVTSCGTGTGTATSCPPQLYVRQYDSNGAHPVVRWISRPAVAEQQIGLMGAGSWFEGASRDGRVVYFRTNAPLTANDPNGAGVAPPVGGVKTGTASANSWDLYRFELPANRDVDPATGTLTRITGGPSGTADPQTNASVSTNNNSSTRFISDDGSRVYFVTDSPIAGADSSPPKGGVTTPGGAIGGPQRNLYLFDANASGADRYKFIARLPTTTEATKSNANCATVNSPRRGELAVQGFSVDSNAIQLSGTASCVKGAPSGNAIAFSTPAQLTGGDIDNASDIYLYDARSDELNRVSAPLPGNPRFGCVEEQNPQKTILFACNADMGFSASVARFEQNLGWGGASTYNFAEDAQGRISFFFESRARLVPEDNDGGYWDVYQWREGKLSLITLGNTSDDAYYSGNSTDGRDVFFQTSQRIDPRELDDADSDIYDARIGGGFPYTPPTPPCDVLALACETNATTPPVAPAPATGAVGASGNVKEKPQPPKCAKGKVRKGGKCVKSKPKRSGKNAKRRTVQVKQGGSK